MQFTKLFNSILDSTIWQEPPATKLVWITLLAMSDRNGEVFASIPGLAKRAGVTLAECESALLCLKSPDKYSRTKDHEGRRIVEGDGSFRLLNHGKYRALLSAEERKEYNRKKQAEYRASQKMSMTVNDTLPGVSKKTHTEAEAEAEAEKTKRQSKAKATLDEVKSFAKELNLPESDGESCFHKWEGNGWKNGTNSIKDWKATIRSWKAAGFLPSQKQPKFQQPKRTPTSCL